MGILDEIAKGGTARPLAAFMVGRENRRQRERQEANDKLREESQLLLNEFRTEQLNAIKSAPAERKAQLEAERAQLAVFITAIDASSVDKNKKDVAKRLALSGQKDAAVKLITSDPKGADAFTLAPGSIRFDAEGNQIANNPKVPGDDALPKIQNFADADGNVKVVAVVGSDEWNRAVSDPNLFATGPVSQTQRQIVETREIFPEDENNERAKPPPGLSLWDLAEVASGPTKTISGGVEQGLSLAGMNVDTPVTEARQTFATENNNLIRALSINPRFPVAEINRIRDEIKAQPGFFVAPNVLKARLRSIDVSLRFRMQQAKNDANNSSLPKATRESQAANAVAIQNYLDVLRAPQEGEESGGIKILSRRPSDGE